MIDRALARDAAALGAGQFVVRLIGLLATLQLTRQLGPSGFGTLSLGLGIALIFSVGAGLGLDDLVVRELARRSPACAALVTEALLVRLAALAVGLLAVLGIFVLHPDEGRLYLALLLYSLLHSCVLLTCAVFRGRGRAPLQGLLLALQVCLIGACAVAAARLTADPATVALGYAVATAIALAVGQALMHREGLGPGWRWRLGAWSAHARAALPYAASTIGLLLYDRVALFAVAAIAGPADAGQFGAAHNVVLGLTNLPAILMLAAFPGLARAAVAEPSTIGPAVAALARLVAIAGLGLAVALNLFAGGLVALLFGPDFAPSVGLLQVLSLAAPPFFLSIAFKIVLEATDRPLAGARAIGLALAIAGPATLAGVWLWGREGGAAAYLAAHLLLAGILARLVFRAIGSAERRTADPTLAAVAVGAGDGA